MNVLCFLSGPSVSFPDTSPSSGTPKVKVVFSELRSDQTISPPGGSLLWTALPICWPSPPQYTRRLSLFEPSLIFWFNKQQLPAAILPHVCQGYLRAIAWTFSAPDVHPYSLLMAVMATAQVPFKVGHQGIVQDSLGQAFSLLSPSPPSSDFPLCCFLSFLFFLSLPPGLFLFISLFLTSFAYSLVCLGYILFTRHNPKCLQEET